MIFEDDTTLYEYEIFIKIRFSIGFDHIFYYALKFFVTSQSYNLVIKVKLTFVKESCGKPDQRHIHIYDVFE